MEKSTKIEIGADELILWLRKNNKAVDIPNDEAQGLGMKIYELIVTKLGGTKLSEREEAHWANLVNDKNVGKYDLPKSAAQYEINSSKLEELYVTLNKW